MTGEGAAKRVDAVGLSQGKYQLCWGILTRVGSAGFGLLQVSLWLYLVSKGEALQKLPFSPSLERWGMPWPRSPRSVG